MSTNQEDLLTEDSPASRAPAAPRRFQFSLRTLIWIMTGTAVLCSLVFTIPAYVAIPIMLFISAAIMPAVWTTVIIYGRGYQRTFGIGAIFPAALFLPFSSLSMLELRFSNFGMQDEGAIFARLLMLGLWVSSFLVGIVCVGVRRFLERQAAAASKPEALARTASDPLPR